MNTEDISALWAEDSIIDRKNLASETLRSSVLHQKYLALLMQCKGRAMRLQHDYATMKEFKVRYFNGEVNKDELASLGLNQYQGLRPLKTDMATKLDGDQDLQKIKMKMQYSADLMYQLESILHAIKGRDWGIRNHIENQKFEAGM